MITTAQPAKSRSASSSARSVSTSRSFVGSSSSSRLPPERSSLARWTRFRSPPERSPTRFCWSPPRKLNHETYWRELHLALAELDHVVAAARSPSRPCSCGSSAPRDWSTYASSTVSPTSSVPRVGLLLAGDHPEERRLAGAVRADHADDPARRQVEREVLDQQAVAEALLHVLRADDHVAEPRAGRDVDLDDVEPRRLVLGQQLLVRGEARLRLRVPRASGSSAPTRARAVACGGGQRPASPRPPSRASFCSSHDE